MSVKRRFTYLRLNEERLPVPGELVRSSNTGNFINLVISVDSIKRDSYFWMGKQRCGDSARIISVRYADTNGNDRILLRGRRARPFIYDVRSSWHLVEEFSNYDNTADIAAHMKSLEGVNLLWQLGAEDDK